MKKFNDSQRKSWVLTGLLLSTLSFSVAFEQRDSGEKIALLNLSSTSEPSIKDLTTTQGTYDVVVMDAGSGKTKAMLLKTEADKTCEGLCGNSYVLDVKMDDIKGIKSALVKQIADSKKTKIDEKEDKKLADPKDEAKLEEDKKLLERIVTRCRLEDGLERTSCKIRELHDLLKDKRKSIDKGLAFDFFKREIESPLKGSLTNYRNPIDREKAFTLVDELEANTPEKYNSIRERVLVMGAETLRSSVQRVRSLNQQAQSMSSDNPYKLQLQQQALVESTAAKDFSLRFEQYSGIGLNTAVTLQNLDADLKDQMLRDLYSVPAHSMTSLLSQAERSNNFNFRLPSTNDIRSFTDSELVLARAFIDSLQSSGQVNPNNQNNNGRFQVPNNNNNGRVQQPNGNNNGRFQMPNGNNNGRFQQPGFNNNNGFQQPGFNNNNGFQQPGFNNNNNGFQQPGFNNNNGFQQPGFNNNNNGNGRTLGQRGNGGSTNNTFQPQNPQFQFPQQQPYYQPQQQNNGPVRR